CNILAEMRSYGEGIIVCEQIPSKIAPEVLKNTNTKIVHRLVSRDDQIFVSGSIGMKEEESTYLAELTTGFALCGKEGMNRAVHVKVETSMDNEREVGEDVIRKETLTPERFRKIEVAGVKEKYPLRKEIIRKLMFSLLINPSAGIGYVDDFLKFYLRISEDEEVNMRWYLLEEILSAMAETFPYLFAKGIEKEMEEFLINRNKKGLFKCLEIMKEKANKDIKDVLREYIWHNRLYLKRREGKEIMQEDVRIFFYHIPEDLVAEILKYQT
ncbi:hypothetical protein DRQ18_06895, partial [bacterium]